MAVLDANGRKRTLADGSASCSSTRFESWPGSQPHRLASRVAAASATAPDAVAAPRGARRGARSATDIFVACTGHGDPDSGALERTYDRARHRPSGLDRLGTATSHLARSPVSSAVDFCGGNRLRHQLNAPSQPPVRPGQCPERRSQESAFDSRPRHLTPADAAGSSTVPACPRRRLTFAGRTP